MIVILSILFLGLIATAVFAPKEVDWSLSYSQKDDIPLGNKLVFEVLPTLFPNQSILTSHARLSDFLEGTIPVNTNFIYINESFTAEGEELENLFDIIEAGNNVFIAAEQFSPAFRDSMGISLLVPYMLNPSFAIADSIRFSFTNQKLNSITGYWYKKAVSNNIFASYDSTRTTVLGYNQSGKTNFIRMKFGEGFLYLNCNPLAFTNYHLLSNANSEYIFKCLSYLPASSTVWDEHHKARNQANVSQLDYILTNRALRIAWYIVLLGVVLYFVFEGKRRQRAIPVYNPPQNNSLEFVETVSRLYFNRQDHKGIAHKRFVFFLDFLKERYFIDINADESRLMEEISQKSGIAERSVVSLFRVARNLETVNYISQEDLQQFNRQLEYFYKNCR